MIRDLATAFAAFVVVSAIAGLLGAPNLGTALTFGVIAFMATIVGSILLRGPESAPPGDAPAEDAPRTRSKPSGRPRA
jgi:hypothetical protein